MSGYVERTFVFPGFSAPGEFFNEVYTPSHDARHIKVVRTEIRDWGDELWVIVSAECDETINWHLQDWLDKEKKQ